MNKFPGWLICFISLAFCGLSNANTFINLFFANIILGHVGAILESSWDTSGQYWAILGVFWSHFGAFGGHLGPSWNPSRTILGPNWPSLAYLGLSRDSFGPCWGLLAANSYLDIPVQKSL